MSAFPGEVDTAFKTVKKLVDKGLVIYDDELKNRRNLKDQKGIIKIKISCKKGIKNSKPKNNTIFV